ncbi:MAG TPA: DJ-1/PfpI family protein [Actinomycetota bacterium]
MTANGKKQVAFVLYPEFTLLDVAGPLQVFSHTNMFSKVFEPVVVAERAGQFTTDTPMPVTATHTFEDVPQPSIVLVPGGSAATIRAMGDEAIRDYLSSVAETADVVGSVCTGSLILGAAGFLEGRRATTHWAFYSLLEKLGATYQRERWVEDGKFVTAAGVSAGIDLGLHLVGRFTDEMTARLVQARIEYDPEPPFGRLDWSLIDRDVMAPMIKLWVTSELADRPDLQARLGM